MSILKGRPQVADASTPLRFVPASCCICGREEADLLAVGEDFEYRTSPDSFRAVRCRHCELIYLNPRPANEELSRIYPDNYHAFEFSPDQFGFVYKVRRRLEARRALSWCEGLPPDAKILDVGCGDGFHLRLLKDFGSPGWSLEGVDSDARAVAVARSTGLNVHQGRIEELGLSTSRYDLVLLIMTIEHVEDPKGFLRAVTSLLRPGGRVVIITDNTDAWDCKVFQSRHWGGYHFPRHWNLFNRKSLAALASGAGLDVAGLTTRMSPVNWVYSVHNFLVDRNAPRWLINRFTLKSPLALAVFTLWDSLLQRLGRGAILEAVLRRPFPTSSLLEEQS